MSKYTPEMRKAVDAAIATSTESNSEIAARLRTDSTYVARRRFVHTNKRARALLRLRELGLEVTGLNK